MFDAMPSLCAKGRANGCKWDEATSPLQRPYRRNPSLDTLSCGGETAYCWPGSNLTVTDPLSPCKPPPWLPPASEAECRLSVRQWVDCQWGVDRFRNPCSYGRLQSKAWLRLSVPGSLGSRHVSDGVETGCSGRKAHR